MSAARRADIAYLIALFAGTLFIVFLGPLERRLELVHMNDFSGVWSGGRSLLAGVDPYDPARYPAAAIALGTKTPDALVYDYLPWVAFAITPLAALPLEVAAWIWMIASMACAALALRGLLRAFVPGRPAVHGALGLALFVGQPSFHTLVLGQWALLLMSALAAVTLALRAGRLRRAAAAALAFLAKPQLFVWSALGLALHAWQDERRRRFVLYAVVAGAVVVLVSSAAIGDWLGAWLADVPARRTARSAVLPSALGQLLGTPGRVLAYALIAAGVGVATRFRPSGDAALAVWLALSAAGALYSWSYDQVLLFVPLVIACGVLARRSEKAARRFALAGALWLLLVSPVLYAIAVLRHDETFSVVTPLALFCALAVLLWPQRADADAA